MTRRKFGSEFKIEAVKLVTERGSQRAAIMYSLITTAKMNGIAPQAWLADIPARIANHPAHRLDALMPWNWRRRPVVTVPFAA